MSILKVSFSCWNQKSPSKWRPNLQIGTYLHYGLSLTEQDQDHSPKWSNLTNSNATGGNSGTPSHLTANNNSHVHGFKTADSSSAAAAAAAAAAGYHPGGVSAHAHLGHHVSGQPGSTISSQFSALLGASSAGYLLTSESKTMPIFWTCVKSMWWYKKKWRKICLGSLKNTTTYFYTCY